MPSSTVSTFDDPDAYHSTIRASGVRGIITSRGNFTAELTRIDLHRLWIQRSYESLPEVIKFASSGQRIVIFFAIDPSQAVIHLNGVELPQHDIITWGAGLPRHLRSSAAFRWGAMSLPQDDLIAAGSAIIGSELRAPTFARPIRPPAPLLSRLRSLHEAAGHLAKTAPDILANPEVGRAIERELVDVMVHCLSGGEEIDRGRAHRHHLEAIRRLERVLEANPDRTFYSGELCSAAGVSDRTLRVCCQEHLGMSPKRYLWLRRMHLARRALRMADRATATVTEIATNYGFWEFGRFSVGYRSLFGESPSTTLRRPPDDPRPQKIIGSPWQLPESA